MEEFGTVLCIHSEVSKAEIDIFDREGAFIQEVVTPLLRDFQKFALNTNLEPECTIRFSKFPAWQTQDIFVDSSMGTG